MTDKPKKQLKRILVKEDGEYDVRHFYDYPYQSPDWMKSTEKFEPYPEEKDEC